MLYKENEQTHEKPSETQRRRGKDNPPNRNNRTAEDAPYFVPERYRF